MTARKDLSPVQSGTGAEADHRDELERFFDLSNELLCIAGTDGYFKRVNPRFREVLGWTEDELLTRPILEFVHPDDVEATEAEVERQRRGEPVAHFVNRYRRCDGGYRWFEWASQPTGDGVLYAVARDITERRELEEILRDTQQLARVGGWSYDLRARELHWTDEVYRILELPVGEPVDLERAIGFYHPEHRAIIRGAVERAAREGGAWDLELKLFTERGRELWVRAMGQAELQEGRPVRLYGAFQDVDARKRAEMREAELGRLVETSRHEIFVFDPVTGRHLYANRRARENLGYGMPELQERTPGELTVEDDGETVQQILDRVLKSERKHLTLQRVMRRRDGSTYHLEMVARRGEYLGRPVLVAFGLDVTERLAREREHEELQGRLQEVQKLESLGLLAGGIAHDFNNLLTGILGNASVMRGKIGPDAAVTGNLDQIEHAAERATELCNQMLAYSGRGRFVIEALDLTALVQDMVEVLMVSLGRRVPLELELAGKLPAIEGDATQLRQVVMNLVANAADAVQGAGRVFVRTGVREFHGRDLRAARVPSRPEPGRYVFFEVEDEGKGMEEEVLGRLFDPFFTTKESGRGLGLSAVQGIVHGHGGAILVTSEWGQGSRFTVLLPVSGEVAAPAPEAPRKPARVASGGRVLVIDDEDLIRRLAREGLTSHGFEVTVEESGEAGIERYRGRPDAFDVVLLDLTMPGMDGEQVLAELRRIDPSVRVVLSSGYDRRESEQRFAGQHLAGFLQKPYRIDQLLRAVSGALL